MARGVTLDQLVQDVRFEVGDSTSESMNLNTRTQYIHRLQREQERLYDEYDWPFMRVTRDKVTNAGQNEYDFPSDINLERIEKVEFQWGGSWIPLKRGILTTDYTIFDSDADERSDPPQKWDIRDTGSGPQMEIWPMPASTGSATTERLRITGIKSLGEFTAGADVCDLDGVLITLFAAAGLLAKKDAKDAQYVLGLAAQRLRTLRGRLKAGKRLILGGGEGSTPTRPPELRVSYVRD
jgi:hypothetical protein